MTMIVTMTKIISTNNNDRHDYDNGLDNDHDNDHDNDQS